MTSLSIQNTGIGSCIIDELCQYMKKSGITGLRLGWAKGNLHAEHFWHKNGFQETGITYNAGSYTVVLAHRNLWLISEQWHKPTNKQCKQHTNYHNPDIFIRRSRYLAFFCCKFANMYQQLDSDTICAISTPSGVGGIAIIRVSGPEA